MLLPGMERALIRFALEWLPDPPTQGTLFCAAALPGLHRRLCAHHYSETCLASDVLLPGMQRVLVRLALEGLPHIPAAALAGALPPQQAEHG